MISSVRFLAWTSERGKNISGKLTFLLFWASWQDSLCLHVERLCPKLMKTVRPERFFSSQTSSGLWATEYSADVEVLRDPQKTTFVFVRRRKQRKKIYTYEIVPHTGGKQMHWISKFWSQHKNPHGNPFKGPPACLWTYISAFKVEYFILRTTVDRYVMCSSSVTLCTCL